MAELKDVYSLEFNSSQFQSEVQSAISRVEELNSAMEEGADVAGELESAQGNLVSVLGMEAKGIENLNAKRNVLVGTSKQLNAESKAGVVVGKQLDTTNKQIAVSTGQAATQQRGFGASLLAGTRQISQMRRVVSTLTFVFRGLAAALPFGLIMAAAGPIISFFSSLFTSTDKSAEAMEKLNDKTLSYTERLDIAKTELERLNDVEAKRGYLTQKEKEQREELTKVYQQTADEIVKIETDRYFEIADLQTKAARIGLKLRGESFQTIKEGLEIERKATMDSYKRREDELTANIKSLMAKEILERSRGNEELAIKLNKEWSNLEDIRGSLWTAQTREIELLEKEAADKSLNLAIKYQKEKEKKEAEFRKMIERLENKATKTVIENIKKSQKAFEDAAKRKIQAEKEYQEMLSQSQKNLQDSINDLKKRLNDESDILQNSRERQLSLELVQLESERNNKLLFARQTIQDKEKLDAELQKIDEGYNKRREQLELQSNVEIIKNRINLLNQLRNVAVNQKDDLLISDIDKQISELSLKLVEAQKPINDTADAVKKVNKELKEVIDAAAQFTQIASDAVFSVLNAQVQAYINGLDMAIDKSKSALDEIRSNSENYNARQLEIEKERLEKLEAERARAVQREKNLATVQLAINSAIAISKAAAEGGAAAPFTIALTLAALIAGLAQARVAAGNAFYHGVEYLERGQNKSGRDTIPAMLNEGERVITTDTNAKYWDVLSAVHNNKIPANVLNGFASAYQQGGLKSALGSFGDNISLSGELGQKAVFVNVAHNNSGLENRLERIESALMELPKYMPKTTVSANAKGIFRIVEQRQQRKDYSRNWAK
jgi:hypothetical protein